MFDNDSLFDFLNEANAHMHDYQAAQHMQHVWDRADANEEAAIHEHETYCENGWLRAAEMPTYDDMGFEEYERSLGKF